MSENSFFLDLNNSLNGLSSKLINKNSSTDKHKAKLKRNIDIFKFYHGLQDGVPHSMDDTGLEFNLTKEAIRVIVNEVSIQIKMKKIFPSMLKDIVSYLEKSSPVSEDKVFNYIKSKYSIVPSFDFKFIYRCLDVFHLNKKSLQLVSILSKSFIISKSSRVEPKDIMSKAIKEVSHNGFDSIPSQMNLIKGIKLDIKYDFIKDVLSSNPNIIWLNNDCFHFGTEGKNRIIERMYKIFKKCQSIHIDDLLSGINRSLSKNPSEHSKVLIKEVAVNIILNDKSLSIDENGQISRVNKEFFDKINMPVLEDIVVEAVLVGHDTKYSVKQFVTNMLGSDFSPITFYDILRFSPLIKINSEGFYRLVNY